VRGIHWLNLFVDDMTWTRLLFKLFDLKPLSFFLRLLSKSLYSVPDLSLRSSSDEGIPNYLAGEVMMVSRSQDPSGYSNVHIFSKQAKSAAKVDGSIVRLGRFSMMGKRGLESRRWRDLEGEIIGHQAYVFIPRSFDGASGIYETPSVP